MLLMNTYNKTYTPIPNNKLAFVNQSGRPTSPEKDSLRKAAIACVKSPLFVRLPKIVITVFA